MDDHDRFIRQRRNLMAISLLLLFAEISGIRIEEINVLGNKVRVDNPSGVYIALWIAFLYWLARYYQYFLEVRHKNNSFYARLDGFAYKKAEKILLKQLDVIKSSAGKDTTSISGKILDRIAPHHRSICFNYDFTSEEGKKVNGSETINLNRFDLIYPKMQSGIYVCFKTTYFTEYILPFMIALLPVVYKLYLITASWF